MKYIKEFEGLRGLMAMWVVFGHWASSIMLSFAPFDQKFYNGYAVDVFVILSGFAITALIENKHEKYGGYITRRFFRIFPVYLFYFFLSVASIHMALSAFTNGPPSLMQETRIIIAQDSIDYMYGHILSHIFAVHGLLPESWLPSGAYAFLGQAWSISLEWQFYLIAPFVIHYMKGPKTLLQSLAILSFFAVTIFYDRYASKGFIGGYYQFFALGIGSFYLIKFFTTGWGSQYSQYIRPIFLATMIFILSFANKEIIPYFLWAIMVYVVLANYFKLDGISQVCSLAINSRPVQFLGRMSYSIYLSHMLVAVASLQFLNQYPDMRPEYHAAILLFFMTTGTVIFSFLSYKCIELPFMRYGKALSKKING